MQGACKQVCAPVSFSVCLLVDVCASHRATHLQQYLVSVKLQHIYFPWPSFVLSRSLLDELVITTHLYQVCVCVCMCETMVKAGLSLGQYK